MRNTRVIFCLTQALFILLLQFILGGCAKDESRSLHPPVTLEVATINGQALAGHVLRAPQLYVSVKGVQDENSSFLLDLRFSGDISRTVRLKGAVLTEVELPASLWGDGSSSARIELVLRGEADGVILYRTVAMVGMEEINAEVEEVCIVVSGKRRRVEDGELVTFLSGTSGTIQVRTTHPVLLKHLEYRVNSNSGSLAITGTFRSGITTYNSDTWSEIGFTAGESGSSGEILICLGDDAEKRLFSAFFKTTKLDGGDPASPDDNPSSDSTPFSYAVRMPAMVFSDRGFNINIDMPEEYQRILYHAQISIDSQLIPACYEDSDWYKFQYEYKDFVPVTDRHLYVSSHSVEPGYHFGEITLWRDGDDRSDGITKEFEFIARELQSSWAYQQDLSPACSAWITTLDVPLTSTPGKNAFVLALAASGDNESIDEIIVSSAESFCKISSLQQNQTWLLESPRRGRHLLLYDIKTTDKVTYRFEAKPFFYEQLSVGLSITGDKLYIDANCAGTYPDFSLQTKLVADIYAVIPYTEAAMEGENHVDKEQFQYNCIASVSKDVVFPKNTQFMKTEVYSGIENAIKLAQKQLSSYKAKKNGASRWKYSDGKWSVEKYTPSPYLLAQTLIEWKPQDGDYLEFISAEFNIQSLRETLGDRVKVLFSEKRMD